MVNESVPQGQHFINRILQITETKTLHALKAPTPALPLRGRAQKVPLWEI